MTVTVVLAVATTAVLTVWVSERGPFRAQRSVTGAMTAISIHVHGTDVTRVGSSVRRYYLGRALVAIGATP